MVWFVCPSCRAICQAVADLRYYFWDFRGRHCICVSCLECRDVGNSVFPILWVMFAEPARFLAMVLRSSNENMLKPEPITSSRWSRPARSPLSPQARLVNHEIKMRLKERRFVSFALGSRAAFRRFLAVSELPTSELDEGDCDLMHLYQELDQCSLMLGNEYATLLTGISSDDESNKYDYSWIARMSESYYEN